MVSQRLTVLGAAGVALAVLAGCANGGSEPDETPSGDPFVVYMNTPATGGLANASAANVEALEVVVEAINAEGGILGRPVELVVADDDQAGSTDPDEVKAALEDLDTAPIADRILTFASAGWTPESHFFEPPVDEVFSFIAPGPLVDGVVTPAE